MNLQLSKDFKDVATITLAVMDDLCMLTALLRSNTHYISNMTNPDIQDITAIRVVKLDYSD